MTRARDIADLGQDKTTLASYVDTGVTSTDLERIDITTEGTSENSKVVTANSSGHVTLAGELRGPATFVVDPAAVGDNTGLLQVKGNLQVDGTTTTINSTTLTVDDKNIVLGSGAADSAAADGAGLTIDGASATMLYTHSTTSFDFNKPVNVTGNASVSADLTVDTSTLKVDSSNNRVGIGTAAPNKQLEISNDGTSGNIPTLRLNSTEGNVGNGDVIGQIDWKSADAGRTGDPIASIKAVSSIADGSHTDLTFSTGEDSNSASERMRITSGGDVELKTAGKRYYIPRASDGALTGSLYSSADSTVTLSGAGSSAGKLEFISSSTSGSALNINSAGNIGVGTTAPSTILNIVTEGGNNELKLETFSDTEAHSNYITFSKADGTVGSPGLVDDDSIIGGLSFQAYDGSNYHEAALIKAQIDGTPSDGTDMPTELVFATTADGAGSPTTRMVISPSGNVQIPAGKVGINTTSLDATILTGKTSGSDNCNIYLGATGTGNAEIVLDGSNGDFSGSDYYILRQTNALDVENWLGTSGDYIFKTAAGTERMRIASGGTTTFEGEAKAKKFWGLTKVDSFGSGGAVNSGSYYSAVGLSSLETGQLYLFNAYHSQYSDLYWGLFWVMKTSSSAGYVDKIFPSNSETIRYQGRISNNHVQFVETSSGWNGPTHYGEFYKVHYFYSS